MSERICLYQLPLLTPEESDFVATVTSDPGQAQDFTEGFEQLVESLSEARATAAAREAKAYRAGLEAAAKLVDDETCMDLTGDTVRALPVPKEVPNARD